MEDDLLGYLKSPFLTTSRALLGCWNTSSLWLTIYGTPVNRSQAAPDTAQAKQRTERAHR